jgi:rubrerythrin
MPEAGTKLAIWKCGFCNYVFKSSVPPKMCPLCKKESEFIPFENIRDFSEVYQD